MRSIDETECSGGGDVKDMADRYSLKRQWTKGIEDTGVRTPSFPPRSIPRNSRESILPNPSQDLLRLLHPRKPRWINFSNLHPLRIIQRRIRNNEPGPNKRDIPWSKRDLLLLNAFLQVPERDAVGCQRVVGTVRLGPGPVVYQDAAADDTFLGPVYGGGLVMVTRELREGLRGGTVDAVDGGVGLVDVFHGYSVVEPLLLQIREMP